LLYASIFRPTSFLSSEHAHAALVAVARVGDQRLPNVFKNSVYAGLGLSFIPIIENFHLSIAVPQVSQRFALAD
jgi:hypothetical protein